MELEKINACISQKHTLCLYGSNINKWTILSSLTDGNDAVLVTTENPTIVTEKVGNNFQIFPPERIKKLKTFGQKLIIDCASIDQTRTPNDVFGHLRRERHLNKTKLPAVCAYDITKIEASLLKELVALHDGLILTTDSTTVLSSRALEDTEITGEAVERFVKKDLKTIVLALMLKHKMCGTDLIKTIHSKFNVFLSPGAVYPLLHSLEKKGLVKSEYEFKTKTYGLTPDAEDKIKKMLEQYFTENRLLTAKLAELMK